MLRILNLAVGFGVTVSAVALLVALLTNGVVPLVGVTVFAWLVWRIASALANVDG